MQSIVLLFDIDGTLIRCGGAGGTSLCRALAEEFNLSQVQPVPLHGRMDLGIINELFENHDIDICANNRLRLCQRYFDLLPAQLKLLSDNQTAHILPGVVELLSELANRSRVVLALLTGNLPISAQIKLEHFGIWSYFKFEVFGDLTDHRPCLAEPAHDAILAHCGRPIEQERIVVIGDTPLDIELAKAMNVRSLAVCTGGFSESDLQAAGADKVLSNLSNTTEILDWLQL